MGVKGKFVQSEIFNLYTHLDEGVYPVLGIYAEYLTRRRDPPLCEVPDIYVGYRIYKIRLDRVCVQCFCISRFFFFLMRSTFQCFSMGSMHSLWNSQTSFFNKTFIKNGSHDTIHTFKNYFVTVFSVFSKISSIQTDPMCANNYVPRVYNFKNVISWTPCQHFVKPRRI